MIGSHNFINFLQYLINGLYNKKQTKYFVDISQLVLDDDISCRHFFEMLTKIAGKTIPFTLILDARKIDPNNFEKFMLGFLSEGKQILLGLNVIRIPKLSKETKTQLKSFFKYQPGLLGYLIIQDLNGEFIFHSEEIIEEEEDDEEDREDNDDEFEEEFDDGFNQIDEDF